VCGVFVFIQFGVRIVVFWIMMPCNLGGYCVFEEHPASIFRLEDGGDMLFQNVSVITQKSTVNISTAVNILGSHVD
jgi:hypothetical protein